MRISCFKINNKHEKRCEVCSKLTIKHQNDVSDAVVVLLLFTWNSYFTSSISIVDFKQVYVTWVLIHEPERFSENSCDQFCDTIYQLNDF